MHFEDVAQGARLRHKVYYGGQTSWKYILETTGCGIAFFDYDNDGWLDVFVVNGWRLEGFPEGENPSNHLYRNNRDGTFSRCDKKRGPDVFGMGPRSLHRRLR